MAVPQPTTGYKPKTYVYLENHYIINKDLLCKSSAYFRDLFASKNREDQDCLICLGSLNPAAAHTNNFQASPKRPKFCDDARCTTCSPIWHSNARNIRPGCNALTVCANTCGKTFHLSCLRRWRTETLRTRRTDNCPHCRQTWHFVFPSLEHMTSIGIDVYLCSLRGRKSVFLSMKGAVVSSYIVAYEAGVYFQDKNFCLDVLRGIWKFCTTEICLPTAADWKMVHEISVAPSALRCLILTLYAKRLDKELRKSLAEEDGFPTSYVGLLDSMVEGKSSVYERIGFDDIAHALEVKVDDDFGFEGRGEKEEARGGVAKDERKA